MKRFGKKWFNLNVNKSTRNSADLFNSTTSESSHYDVCSWCMSLMYVVHLQKIWIKAMWFHNCHKCVQLVFLFEGYWILFGLWLIRLFYDFDREFTSRRRSFATEVRDQGNNICDDLKGENLFIKSGIAV